MRHQVMAFAFFFAAVVYELLHTIQQLLQVLLSADIFWLPTPENVGFYPTLLRYSFAKLCRI